MTDVDGIEELKKPNLGKFLLLVVCVVPIGLLVASYGFKSIERQKLDGIVTEINWNSWDHGMPIIKLEKNGKVDTFKSSRITLTSDSLKVGDALFKESGSKECLVNDARIKCIN